MKKDHKRKPRDWKRTKSKYFMDDFQCQMSKFFFSGTEEGKSPYTEHT